LNEPLSVHQAVFTVGREAAAAVVSAPQIDVCRRCAAAAAPAAATDTQSVLKLA